MSNIDEDVVILVKRLAEAIRKVGIKKVEAVLDKIDVESSYIEAHRSLIDFIIKRTAKKFQVEPNDLKRNNIRGALVDARSMCFVLLKKYLDLKHTDIADLFHCKSHSVVSDALNHFKKLDYNVKWDRKYLDIYVELDKLIEEQKNLLWLKHKV